MNGVLVKFKTMENRKMMLADWLNKKYIMRINETQSPKYSITQLADYLEVSRSLLSRYLSGQILPSGDNIERIANKLGDEIYDILALDRPDPLLRYIHNNWSELKIEQQKIIMEQVEKYVAKKKI